MSPISRHEWEKSKAPLRYFCLSVSLSVWIDNPRKRSKDTHGPIRSLVRCSPYSSSRHSLFNYSSFMLHMRANRGIIPSPYLHTLYSTRNANKNNTVMPMNSPGDSWEAYGKEARWMVVEQGWRDATWWNNHNNYCTYVNVQWTWGRKGICRTIIVGRVCIPCTSQGWKTKFLHDTKFVPHGELKARFWSILTRKSNQNFDIFVSDWYE